MLATFGSDEHGQLGVGARLAQQSAGKPATVVLPRRVAAVSLGAAHSAVVTTGGEVWCWGEADKLGLPSGRSLSQVSTVRCPARVTALRSNRITLVGVGAWRTAGCWPGSGRGASVGRCKRRRARSWAADATRAMLFTLALF